MRGRLSTLLPGGGLHQRPRPPVVVWLPAVIVAVAVSLPLVYLWIRALDSGWDIVPLLLRQRTAEILLRSFLLVTFVTAASVLIAVPLAWITVRTDLPLRRLWSLLTVLPLVIPSYVGAFLVVATLGPRGTMQGVLERWFGISSIPDIHGLDGAAFTITVLSFPYVLLSVRAALWGLDPSLEEAARGLGQGRWQTFWRVTLPQLRPAIGVGALLVALYTLSDFGAVSLLRYETFTWAIYLQYDSAFDRSLAAGLSLVLVGVAATLLYMEAWARGRSRYYRSSVGSARPSSVVSLGGWRWPALAFVAGVVLVSLVLPTSVLVYWAARAVTAEGSLNVGWSAAANSIYSSSLAAGVAAVAALPVVVLTVRHPGRISGLIERLSYIGFALPGIAVALALVFFGVRYATFLYQSLALLVFAYLVLFFPQAMGAVRAAFLQVSPRMEEAARSLGQGPVGVLKSVTVPLVWPGLLAGAALVFLTAMKELPATLLLSPIGFKTLSTSIWTSVEAGFYTRAAVPTLLLILISSVPTAFFFLREPRRGR
mgnify:CR=1 FL=1